MIEVSTLLPGISSIPPSVTLLLFLPLFPIIFLHLSSGNKLPDIPLPLPAAVSNDDLLRTGALLGVAGFTALCIGLWPGALEGLSIWVREGTMSVDVDVKGWAGAVGGIVGVKEERFGALAVKLGRSSEFPHCEFLGTRQSAQTVEGPSPYYVAANHVYALRYYYLSWYHPFAPRPSQALLVGTGMTIALIVVTGKILRMGYEYVPPVPPEPKIEPDRAWVAE